MFRLSWLRYFLHHWSTHNWLISVRKEHSYIHTTTLSMIISMTSVSTHNVAHSTRHSFRPKPTTSPLKSFKGHLSNSCQKMQNSDFQSQFSKSKIIWIFLKKIFTQLTTRLENFLRGWLLVLDLKKGLVECATFCVKSEVILNVFVN